MCGRLFLALRVEDFLDSKFKCAVWSDDLHEVMKIVSVLDFYTAHLASRIIFSDDSKIILFFDLSVLLEPYSLLAWVSDQESWSISTV